MNEDNFESSYQLSRQKLIFIGDVAVGKTSIISNLIGQKFNDEYQPSIGVDFFSKTMKYKGNTIKLQIWDSAGQEKFKSLIPNYVRGSSLIFVVYDITNKTSFINVREWVKFINEIESSTIVLCGNKIDLDQERKISIKEGEQLAAELKCSYYEVSAKTDKNIQKMLYTSVAELPFFQAMLTEQNNNNNNNNVNNTNAIINKEEIFNELVNENNESLNGRKLDSPSEVSKNLHINGNTNIKIGLIPDNSITMSSRTNEKKKCNC